ncbi:hypothetical protein M3690_04205 [Priestia megaterium]|uniref:hypothetical protein n=1 Tax=Priestia megaterium TaxID=1404 RepID=UPI00203A7458|nr:hypothetical protein [Priestia megaterium]MCM3792494.1 hypothetical protein [Priestia megaterium]
MSKLLTIELDNLDSVPKVFYKGEEITDKARIDFSWKTQGDRFVFSPYINIEQMITTDKGKPVFKHIGFNEPILNGSDE